jgi:putative ABC transport system permease protein
MGISLVRGRFFEDRDADTAPPVAIVDESLAQIYWPNQDPVGKRVRRGGDGSTAPWATVIGVVRNVRNRTLEMRSRVEVYWPENQRPSSAMTLAVLTPGNAMSMAPTIQRTVASLDPELPVYRIRTMSEVMGESVARRRLALILLSVFAGLALLLASVGIYGVTSYVVARRQQEIGLRMALGAGRGAVLRLMIGQGMGTIFAGLGIGLLLALLLTRLIGGMLFAVRPADPLALGGAGILLMVVALFAVVIPARRASRMNPVEALRYE